MSKLSAPQEYKASAINRKLKIVLMENGETVPISGMYVLIDGEIVKIEEVDEDGYFFYQIPTGLWITYPFSNFSLSGSLQ